MEDDIVGIWVKVLREGKVVAEIANPSNVMKRGREPKQYHSRPVDVRVTEDAK